MRIALCIEYNGANYFGWQAQKGDLPTIQGLLAIALSAVANHEVQVVGSGRTDRGVHATAQIVHFDSSSDRSMHNWVLGTNAYLPPDIRVIFARPVSDDFHARFKAHTRRYCYIIHPNSVPSGLYNGLVTWDRRSFDVEHMQQAAECLIGEHDFTSFRAVKCQARHPMRTIEHLTIMRQDRLIVIDIQANSFLHHMVRNIAGVLMRIGADEQPVAWCQQVLEARDRRGGDITAAADGLYFIYAGYPESMRFDTSPVWPLLLS